MLSLNILKNFLFVGTDDRIIRVYDINNNFLIVEEFTGHEDGILCLEFADKLLFSGSFDQYLINIFYFSNFIWIFFKKSTIRSWDLEEMINRIRERKIMYKEDVYSRKIEVFTNFLAKKNKKKAGMGKKAGGGKKKGKKKK